MNIYDENRNLMSTQKKLVDGLSVGEARSAAINDYVKLYQANLKHDELEDRRTKLEEDLDFAKEKHQDEVKLESTKLKIESERGSRISKDTIVTTLAVVGIAIGGTIVENFGLIKMKMSDGFRLLRR